jgi:hypothetical protein
MWHKPAFKTLSLLYSAILLLVLFILVYNYVQDNQVQATQDEMMQKTRVAVQQIDEVLNQLSSTAHALADEIGSGQLQRSQIMERLKKTMDKTPQMFGIGVAYIPYQNDPQTRRHSPYYINRQDTHQIEEQDLLQIFTVPCFYNDPTFSHKMSKCVVFIDYSLQDIKALMNTLDFGKTGYGFILSKQGDFIAHPIEEYVKNRKTIFNLAEMRNDNALKRLGERATDNKSGIMEYREPMTGQTSWIFYQPIPTTGWVIATVMIKNEFLAQTIEESRHQQIWLCIWIIICLISFPTLLVRTEFGLWLVVFLSAILLVIGIGFILYLAQTAPFKTEAESALIVDKARLNQFLSSNTKPTHRENPPLFVPTGVSIETVAFSTEGENNVILTGHIWQKYDDDVSLSISRGFVLPEAKSIKITEAYHRQQDQKEVIGWHFESTVPLQFDYSKYPLDRREIQLLIRHKDVDKNVILTPDLEGYQWLNPDSCPGIKHDLALPNWHLKSSFFNYRHHEHDTEKKHFPELYFTVFIQRELLNPFIRSMLPPIVVGGMLFAILLILGKVKTVANVIAPLAALFLGTLLAHIDLRRGIDFTVLDIFYIEYFYIVMYIAILAVLITYFLFHTKSRLFFFQYRDGLVAKLLFWPLILEILLVVTVWMFYDV